MTDEGGEPLDVSAMSVPQETQTLARTIAGSADAHVVEVRQPDPMDGKSTAADVATNLFEDVILRAIPVRDRKDADAVVSRRADQADDTRRGHGWPFSPLPLGEGPGGRAETPKSALP